MATSDFRSEVEIWLFCACTMKNMQYNPYLWPNCENIHILEEIGVEEHDGDVRFQTEVEIWPFHACAMKNMQYSRYYQQFVQCGHGADTTFHRTYF